MPELGASSLGPYPILQLAAAIMVLFGVGLAVFRGMRDKDKPGAADDDPNRLQYQLDQSELKAELARILQANREAFFKSMSDHEKRIQHDLGELDDRVRTLEIEHSGFRERLGQRRPQR